MKNRHVFKFLFIRAQPSQEREAIVVVSDCHSHVTTIRANNIQELLHNIIAIQTSGDY